MTAAVVQSAGQISAQRVLVIVGSVRTRRIGPQMAEWIARIGRDVVDAEFEIIDLKEWPLSMSEEPGIPAIDDYMFEHTHAWSQKIAAAHGFVFVTPQYNWGYPAPLKNALDHLYKEWANKPAVIVTYGGHGGGKCGRQLKQVLKGLKMRPIAVRPAFTLTHDQIKANTGTIDPVAEFGTRDVKLRKAFSQLANKLSTARSGTWWWPW
jgi:NAD(P)H-dependent FMN reductase